MDEFDGGTLVDIFVGVNHNSLDAARRWLGGGRKLRIRRIRLRRGRGTLGRNLIRVLLRTVVRARQNPVFWRDRRSPLRPPLE